jgi:hypothetical protein
MSCIHNREHRVALTRFRISCHSLEIEIGRRNKTVREKRYCQLCARSNHYMVEDEFHMMSYCPTYNYLRSKYDITNQHNTLEELCRQMKCHHKMKQVL